MDIEKLKNNLIKRGYLVSFFETKEAAADYLNAQMDGQTIGMGGSVTFEQMGLVNSLNLHNTVYSNYLERTDELMLAGCNADYYISGVNALTESGDIINIDGRGNRLAGTLMKKKKVFFVLGINKIAPDFDSALYRARNTAAPKNAVRLGTNTPCASQGKCFDCLSPERICSALLVLWKKPMWAEEMEVVIINEVLGY